MDDAWDVQIGLLILTHPYSSLVMLIMTLFKRSAQDGYRYLFNCIPRDGVMSGSIVISETITRAPDPRFSGGIEQRARCQRSLRRALRRLTQPET